jgi:hypothetical protein
MEGQLLDVSPNLPHALGRSLGRVAGPVAGRTPAAGVGAGWSIEDQQAEQGQARANRKRTAGTD